MTKGRKEPKTETDQKCPYCGRWFSSKGWKSHVYFCNEKEENQPYPWEIDQRMDSNVMDRQLNNNGKEKEDTQMSKEKESKQEEKKQKNDKLICPDCGNIDNDKEPYIYESDKSMKEIFKENDIWEENKQAWIRYDYLCWQCKEFFNE